MTLPKIPTVNKVKEMIEDGRYLTNDDITKIKKEITNTYVFNTDSIINNTRSEIENICSKAGDIDVKLSSTVKEKAKSLFCNWETDDIPTHKITLDADIIKIVYGRGRFVGITQAAKVYWSIDGIDWNESFIYGLPWANIAYGNGKFVAVAPNYTQFAYSSDGANWSYTTAFNIMGWIDVCYGNGKFIAISSTVGNYAYSSDGINWTRGANYDITFKHICYGNGKFVVTLRYSPYIAYSSDGLSWTTCSGVETPCFNICAGKFANGNIDAINGFLATNDDSNFVFLSSDAITWTRYSTSITFSTINDIFNSFGYYFIVTNKGVYYSSNPQDNPNWELLKEDSNENYKTVCYADRRLVIAGNAGYILTYELITDLMSELYRIKYPIGSDFRRFSDLNPCKLFPCTLWDIDWIEILPDGGHPYKRIE